MVRRYCAIVLVLCASVMLPAYGQKSTEVFIPIGESPGLSGKYSVIGKIGSFDSETRILTIHGEDGELRIRITDETKIWLDNSAAKKTSKTGSQADCQQGRMCEVKYAYAGKTRTDRAEWIKIRTAD